ncbi:DUF3617 family protein [Dyella sp. S184]|uniref:DUF3617 domain-containing protein n=1 Tax=Dyella sp. S184 TaxID=1641862 RepID=UPI00131C7C86|nr:DUF3617 family protein [Dyella sp. S184]
MSARIRFVVATSLLILACVAVASDLPGNLPKRKAGLWEIQDNVMNGAASPHAMPKICLDADTDQALYRFAAKMSGAVCSKMDFNVSGNSFTVDSVCQMQGPQGTMHMVSHSETHFDGDIAYHTDTHMQYQPAILGKTSRDVSSNGRWLGPCAAGQKPGDMIMPNGSVMNISTMMH